MKLSHIKSRLRWPYLLLALIFSTNLSFSTALFAKFPNHSQGFGSSSRLQHDFAYDFFFKPHLHTHFHDGVARSHFHDHAIIFETVFLGVLSFFEVIFILPILINRIRAFCFLHPESIISFSIFRPPKVAFAN
jgi:hypothetical protein